MSPSWHQAGCCCSFHCSQLSTEEWNAFVASEADRTANPKLSWAYRIVDYYDGDIKPSDACYFGPSGPPSPAYGTPYWPGTLYAAEYHSVASTGRQWNRTCHWMDISKRADQETYNFRMEGRQMSYATVYWTNDDRWRFTVRILGYFGNHHHIWSGTKTTGITLEPSFFGPTRRAARSPA